MSTTLGERTNSELEGRTCNGELSGLIYVKLLTTVVRAISEKNSRISIPLLTIDVGVSVQDGEGMRSLHFRLELDL